MSFLRRIWNRECRPTVVRLVVVLCVLGAAVWSSARAGEPTKLPDVAMGWMLLFHVERAAVLLAAIGAALLIGWRASRGDFPVRFGQVEYAVREAARDVEGKNEALERRLRTLEAVVGIRNSHEPGR